MAAAAAVLAAAVFMLGGPASGRLQHTGMIISYALFPPALLLLQLALERRSMLIGGGFACGRGHAGARNAITRRCSCASCWPPF